MSNLVGLAINHGAIAEAEELLSLLESREIDDPDRVISIELHRASIQESHGKLDNAKSTIEHALILANEHTLPTRQIDAHRRLRDLALKQSNLSDYVKHNDEFTRITNEVRGFDTATKLAMQEAERNVAKERNEREREQAILYSTLPRHIAVRVIRGEQVTDHIDHATVMFLDIVGFTTLSSALTSQQVTTLLDEVFAICDDACLKHAVTRVKTIGDSYLAFCDIDY